MRKAKKNAINETFNELLLQVFTGIDYATKIALKTRKSIPVVYRQLDSLVSLGILEKKRDGKKMAYSVNWTSLSDIISSAIFLDIGKIREITKASEKETKIINEIKSLIGEVPKELFTSKKALSGLVKRFFSRKDVTALTENFFKEIEAGKDYSDFKRLSFEETITLYVDMFGTLDKEKQNKIIARKLDTKENTVRQFITYCRIRYLQKQLYDPRNKVLKMMREE